MHRQSFNCMDHVRPEDDIINVLLSCQARSNPTGPSKEAFEHKQIMGCALAAKAITAVAIPDSCLVAKS